MARTKNTPIQNCGSACVLNYVPPLARLRAVYQACKAGWEAKNPGTPYPHPLPQADSRHGGATCRALAEIHFYQKAEGLLVPKIPFQRLVWEITLSISRPRQEVWFQSIAIAALQEAAEAYLASFFEAANMCAIHTGRVTIKEKDMKLVRWFCSYPVAQGNPL